MHEKFPQILKMFGSQKNPMSIMYLLYICIYMIKAPFGWCRYIYMYMRIYIYTHTYYTCILLYGFFWLSTDFPEGAAMRRLFGLSKVELFVIHQKHLKHRDFCKVSFFMYHNVSVNSDSV